MVGDDQMLAWQGHAKGGWNVLLMLRKEVSKIKKEKKRNQLIP